MQRIVSQIGNAATQKISNLKRGMKIGYVNAERRSNRACCQCTGTYFTQNTLFGGALRRPIGSPVTHEELMQSIDQINTKFGRNTISLAAEKLGRQWHMNRQNLSPCYTTRMNDLLLIP